ncbi:MAG: hypothetical protein KJ767_00290, partial [Nanoarchaeota archaeon]|nr:hypothetical protein [Nanoarchaeota archaeon]
MKFLNSFAKALIIARAKEKRVAHAMHTIERLHKSQLPLMPRQIQRIPAPRALPTRFPRPIQNQQQMQERQQKMQEQRQEHEIQLKQIQMPQMPRQEQSRQQIIQQSRQEIPKITNISDEYVRIQLPEKSTAISQEMLKQPMLERQEQQTPAQTMQ